MFLAPETKLVQVYPVEDIIQPHPKNKEKVKVRIPNNKNKKIEIVHASEHFIYLISTCPCGS